MAELICYPTLGSEWGSGQTTINYTVAYDPLTNRTVITLLSSTHRYFGRSGYYSKATTAIKATANDNTESAGAATLFTEGATNGGQKTFTATPSPTTITVQHNNKPGIKSVMLAINTSIWCAPAATSKTQSWVYGNSSTVLETGEIPAVSEISVSPPQAKLGGALAVSLYRYDEGYTHTLRYKFGGASGTIASGVEASYNWEIPIELAKQIPDATSELLTVYCDTYDGDTLMGTSSAEITATVPDNEQTKPVATMALSPVGDLPDAFSGLFIKGKTGVKADYVASSAYSSIASYGLSVGGMNAEGDPCATDILSTSGSLKAVGTVTDTRGYATVLTQEITVYPYDSPSIVPANGQSSIICERCNADGTPSAGGIYLLVKAKRKYNTITAGGAQKNYCVLKCRYKTASASGHSDWITLVAGEDTTSDEFSGVVNGVELSVALSYAIQLAVEDLITGEVIKSYPIPTDAVNFHQREGGNGAAFGKYSEEEGTLESTYKLQMHGNPVKGVGKPEEEDDAVTMGFADGRYLGAKESSDYPGCYYRSVGGVEEWFNPPMAVGVEYRTTERYQTLPTYTKLLNLGTAALDSLTTVKHGLDCVNVVKVSAAAVSTSAYEGDLYDTIPSYYSATDWCRLFANSTSVFIYTGSAGHTRTIIAQFWYTKAE